MYFSNKATWMSLSGAEFKGTEYEDLNEPCSSPIAINLLADNSKIGGLEKRPLTLADADLHLAYGEKLLQQEQRKKAEEQWLCALRIRHEFVVYQNHWDFSLELIYDNIRLARLQINSEQALFYYCHARHIAKIAAERGPASIRESSILTRTEMDLIIAEIQVLKGNWHSSQLYAGEGLGLIKAGKFSSRLDSHITLMTLRFFRILGQS